MCISSTVLWCTTLLKEREGQQCQSWVFTFWDFSAAPLSTAAISTKIKDPNGARPGGDERCRDGTLLWISNAAHVSEVMTGSQAPSTGFPASGPGNKGLLFLVTKHYGSNPMAHVLIGSGNHPEKVHKVWGGKKTTNLCLLWFSQWIDKKSAKKKTACHHWIRLVVFCCSTSEWSSLRREVADWHHFGEATLCSK